MSLDEILLLINSYLPAITAILSCVISIVVAIKRCKTMSKDYLEIISELVKQINESIDNEHNDNEEIKSLCNRVLEENFELKSNMRKMIKQKVNVKGNVNNVKGK